MVRTRDYPQDRAAAQVKPPILPAYGLPWAGRFLVVA